jgi:predicted AAA+ superfamily ATPase
MNVFPVVVVTGARQVGKTTMLQHFLAGNGDYVSFDPSIDVENARQDPDLFLSNHSEPLLLDEVQYAPEVVSALRRHVDADRRPGRFVLTGSQQWGVLKSISESLAGRAVFLEMCGFELAEVARSPGRVPSWLEQWLNGPEVFVRQQHPSVELPYPLYEYIFRGAFPDACLMPVDTIRSFMDGYRRTYIERDVRALANVSDYQLFGRFFQLVSALTAQEINYSQLGRELSLTPKTAASWLDILRGTHQWFELPPFHGNAIKRISGKPKACAGLAVSSPTALGGHPALGSLFETAVVQELRRQCCRMAAPPHFYHWRSHGGAEVDVILERDGWLYPVEIKIKSNPTRNDARGIGAFRKTYPDRKIAPGLILAPCTRLHQLDDHTWVLPWITRGAS